MPELVARNGLLNIQSLTQITKSDGTVKALAVFALGKIHGTPSGRVRWEPHMDLPDPKEWTFKDVNGLIDAVVDRLIYVSEDTVEAILTGSKIAVSKVSPIGEHYDTIYWNEKVGMVCYQFDEGNRVEFAVTDTDDAQLKISYLIMLRLRQHNPNFYLMEVDECASHSETVIDSV